MKLWGGRFTKETNELVNNFNASISFDQKFYKQDIEGSIAHATMLGKQGIIPESESEHIVEGLKGILADIESGKLEITDEYEDIHTFMEATLIERIGDAGKGLLCHIAKLALKESKSPSIIKADLRKGMIPEKRGK